MEIKDDPLILLGLSCPYCGAPSELVEDTEVYGQSYGTKCRICRHCDAWVGCHKGTAIALGRLANRNLRELKHKAHEVFDQLWKGGYMTRTCAYEVLSAGLGLPPANTHIGMFDEEQCTKTIALSNIILKYIS